MGAPGFVFSCGLVISSRAFRKLRMEITVVRLIIQVIRSSRVRDRLVLTMPKEEKECTPATFKSG
jgi:hypothetical protein